MKIDFKKKRFLVMGLGLWGAQVGVARFLAEHNADVVVTDVKKSDELIESITQLNKYPNVQFFLGRHRIEDFQNADCIIKSAGISNNNKYLQIALKHKIPIKTDLTLFFELTPTAEIVGITGTKGKSTISSIIYSIAARARKNVFFGGNIGRGGSIVEDLGKMNSDSLVILELSSWQLESIALLEKSPKYALLSNIFTEHLNYYASFDEYIEAKKNIFKFQTKNDYLVLNYDDFLVRSFNEQAKSKKFFYSVIAQNKKIDTYCDGKVIYFQGDKIMTLNNNKLLGKHNLSNVLGVITLAKILHMKNPLIENVINSFEPIFGRLQLIDEFNGIKFYNDTTATNPYSTVCALNSIADGGRIILIAGGVDKNLSYRELAEVILDKVSALILFEGTASKKILSEIDDLKKEKEIAKKMIICDGVSSMEEAVKIAFSLAVDGDVVLMSPAAASFNMFKNEKERGELFIREVAKLKNLQKT